MEIIVLPARVPLQENILTLRGSFRPVTKVNMICMRNHITCLLKK
jgi:hypothetical protein